MTGVPTAAMTGATAVRIDAMTAVTGGTTAKTAGAGLGCCGDSPEDALSMDERIC